MYLDFAGIQGRLEHLWLKNRRDKEAIEIHHCLLESNAASQPNSFGANLKPNGRQVSISKVPFHSIASQWRSAGCTGISRNALLMSILWQTGTDTQRLSVLGASNLRGSTLTSGSGADSLYMLQLFRGRSSVDGLLCKKRVCLDA